MDNQKNLVKSYSSKISASFCLPRAIQGNSYLSDIIMVIFGHLSARILSSSPKDARNSKTGQKLSISAGKVYREVETPRSR